MAFLWKFERDVPDILWAMMLWKFEILERIYGIISAFATQEPNYQFLMANNWLVLKAKRLKIGNVTKFHKFFCLLKSICK